jgi:hypothetical protein
MPDPYVHLARRGTPLCGKAVHRDSVLDLALWRRATETGAGFAASELRVCHICISRISIVELANVNL